MPAIDSHNAAAASLFYDIVRRGAIIRRFYIHGNSSSSWQKKT